MRFLECLKSTGKMHGDNFSLVNDEEVLSLSHAKVYEFSDAVECLGKMNQNSNIKYCLGRKIELVQRFTTI